MGVSMQHWNGNQLCAIDTETTGLDPFFHEIVQLGILALDSNFEPRRDVLPFYIEIRPEHPERASKEAMRKNGLNLAELTLSGFDREKAKTLLHEWIEKLGLPMRKYGAERCKVMPLVHNAVHDIPFMRRWLDFDEYDEIFHPYIRDTMFSALFCNDRAATHVERVPYSKVNLTYLCSTLKVENPRAHDALADCAATAEVYRKMTFSGLLG